MRTRLRLLLLIFVGFSWVTSRAVAQAVGSLDAGFTRVGYSEVPGITAYSLSPTLQVFSPRAALVATGVFSEFEGGGWNLQGNANGSIFIPTAGHLQTELGGVLAGSAPDSGTGSAALLGQARLHLADARHGLWVGGGLGRAWDGLSWRTTGLAEAAGWARIGSATVVASTSPLWIGDSLRLLDTEATIRLVRGRLELGAYGGFRTWFEPSTASGTAWGGGSAAYWLTDRFALVASGGSYPADFGQGFPGASYIALTLRVATRRPAAPSRVETPEYRLLQPLARPLVPAFQVTTVRGIDRLVRVHAPGATSVELMGDFTEWQPVPLARGTGEDWSVVVPMSRGPHRMNLRVNGGDWGVPPGVTVLNDDFGGVVGVLLVE